MRLWDWRWPQRATHQVRCVGRAECAPWWWQGAVVLVHVLVIVHVVVLVHLRPEGEGGGGRGSGGRGRTDPRRQAPVLKEARVQLQVRPTQELLVCNTRHIILTTELTSYKCNS